MLPFTDVSQEAQASEGNQADVVAQEENQEERAAGGEVVITVGELLSIKQLVVRRGLTVVLMILILAGGITLNEFLTGLLR